MSTTRPAPLKRLAPRWSVGRGSPPAPLASALLPASSAGLFASSAWVRVGPPLSASGPSFGSCPVMLCAVVPLMVAPAVLPIRL